MKKKLIVLTSEFWGIPVSKVVNSLRFDDQILNKSSSIRFYQFIAAVESNLNVKVKDISKILTFNDLINNIGK